MTTTFCTTCGVPLGTPFCGECGAPAPRAVHDIDATVVRSAPLVPRSVEFPPRQAVGEPTVPLTVAPEPTVMLPPLSGPTATPNRTRMGWVIGGAAALLAIVVSVVLAASGTAGTPAADARPSGDAGSSTLDPGTRSALVPPWANQTIGRLSRAELVLGAAGTAVFSSPGHNVCAVAGSKVNCVATPLWHAHDPGALPPLDPSCSSTTEGRWSVFTIGSGGTATATGCSSRPPALVLSTGTAPYNTVIGMGSSGILCYIDAPRGAPTSHTGLACWNPATNHGFVITHLDMRLW